MYRNLLLYVTIPCMTSSCRPTSFICITKDLCKPRRSLCITSMQLIELYNSMMQLHKFLPNRPTKQDLINAGCQINAGGCDLLYEFGDLRYQLLVWRGIYYYVRTDAKILVIRKFWVENFTTVLVNRYVTHV